MTLPNLNKLPKLIMKQKSSPSSNAFENANCSPVQNSYLGKKRQELTLGPYSSKCSIRITWDPVRTAEPLRDLGCS